MLVSLDSELLVMQDTPSERESAFLFLTVSRRPESGAPAVTLETSSLSRTTKTERVRPDHALAAVRAGKRVKPPRRHHAASPRPNNQESPGKSSPRIARTAPSESAGPVSHPAATSLQQQLRGPSSKPDDRSASDESSAPTATDRATVASRVASRQTPSRVFKMERFRVITPAFVHASGASDARSTPLPVIRPTSELLQRSDVPSAAAGDVAETAGDTEDSDARIETSPSSSTLSLAPAGSVTATAPTSTTLLPPKLMLEVFRSKQMPLASPAFFSRHLRDSDATVSSAAAGTQRPPPSRLQVLEWSEWKQQGLTEETAAAAYERMDTAAAAATRPASPAPGKPHTPHATEATRPTALAKRPTATAATAKHTNVQSPKPAHLATTAASPTTASELLDSDERVEALNTPEYKHKRLRAILSSPVEPNEAATAHLRSLASRVNTSFMVSLGAEIDALRREEQHVRSEMHTFIQAERDHLPLKFLFQLPGGAAYCRHRMRRAMALWVLMFEDNQRRMALLQWKAFVEHCRFQDRGKEYQRLAATKRLRVAFDYVLRGFLSQALTKWVETTQMRIWLDRDHAARTIQRQVRRHAGKCRLLALHDAAPVGSRVLRDVYLAPCRDLAFQLPPRIREERRAIWRAAELVQRAYRRRRFRVCLARYRTAAATIQAQHRMRAARARYRVLRRRIIAFQSYVRMLRHRRAYVALRESVVLVQTTFRCVRVRRLRRLILCAQRQQHERVLSSALLVQRLVRGFIGRRRAQALRRMNAEEFNAALVVQRCWYRRNNEWSTFLLLGCLRVKEEEETAFDARVLAYKRSYMAKLIRRAWLAYLRRKRSAAALVIQCTYRRHAAQRAVQRMRDRKMAHRRIKWFFRVHHAKRVRMATLLQFSWLRAAPGRLARHLRYRRLVQQQQEARALYVRTTRAAARMQALVRGHNDRVVARRERSARTIQRTVRAFLHWRRIQRELRRIKHEMAEQTATAYVTTGCLNVFTQRMRVLNGAATQLQRCVRGAQSRSRQTRMIVALELRTRMARRIQHLWRCNAHWRMAKKLLVAQRRALTNPFEALTSLSAVLDAALERSSVFFDPTDDLNGMALAVWLRRLGLDAKYLDAFQRSRALIASGASSDATGPSISLSASALRALRRLDADACRQQLEAIGIDDDDLERMLTSLFAHETIAETQQLRRRVTAAQTQLTALQRKRDGARMQLEKLEARQREAESALEDVLNEMQEFRNPPHALRKQHEQRTQALERAVRAVSDTQRLSDAHTAQVTTASRALELLQQQLCEIHEPREVSAVYSQQSLRLVSDRNRIRETYLAHFPGLEARALAFATALEEDLVSTWQLEQFFATHTSVSAVKAHMADLTYFALETDMKKLDHARFVQCADVLQYGVERMCALVAMPIEVVVLAKRDERDAALSCQWGPVHDALLATLNSVHRATRASERARAWRSGLDTLVEMNRTALRVQCMWRRRAAKKLLAIVRDRRDRVRVLAAYVAEANKDHVTPVWAAERKREQDELDAWLDEQARERRREVLSATLRFPYIEAWDESAQMWYYYYEDGSVLDGSGRQYALEGKPVYTIDEEDAAIVIQAAVRAFLVRLECLAREREQRRLERRTRLEVEWMRTQRERLQTITLDVRVRVEANSGLALWLKRRRHAARARASANAVSSSSSGAKLKTKTGKTQSKAPVRPELDRRSSRNDQSVQSTDTDTAWSKQIDALVDGPLAAAYNRSVRAEHRKDWTFPAHSRPLNVHAQATIGLLSQYVAFTHSVARDAIGSARVRFTKGALRFGWREVRSGGDGAQTYYYNRETDETTWDRPAYAFAHEFAATQMQSLARVLVAKNAVARTLDAVSFVETVQSTVRAARKVGWVGFGLEGMTTAVFLSRFGLGKYVKELAKASIDDVLALAPARTKKLGWTKEEVGILAVMAELRPPRLASHRCRRCKYPLSVAATCELSTAVLAANAKHPFAIIPSERLVTQIVSQSLPNQQGRVLALVKAIRASSTPIAFRQLEMHLRKFAGRPDDALSSIGEIASLDVATREPQEQTIATLYLRCIERCVVFAANLELRTLQLHLSAVLRAAMELVPTEFADALVVARTTPLAPDVLARNDDRQQQQGATDCSDLANAPAPPMVERYVHAALARYPAKVVKGLWEQDPSKHQTTNGRARFSLAQLALYLRELGLERVLVWVRSALLCQATFRMHTVRQWYVATQAFRARSAMTIQCAWRVRCARDVAALLTSQQQSDYEQCFEKKTKSFYFVYAPTQEKLLDEPRDESGAVIPFRPMVQDRVTKRWVRAWPHFDKAQRSRRPRDTSDDDASARPPCSICNAARAARRCNECYSPAGDYVDYCLVCFYERHAADNAETSWHSYTALHRMQTPHFRCVECRRFSAMRCLQCDENYCERCFQRLHGKGHTRTAHRCELYDAMAQVCVECEARVAFQQCLVCLDALCEDCMVRTHSKGARAAHGVKLIKQRLADDQVYCEQCHARCGDARCEYCSRALCALCLSDKHALLCPETELKQKRLALLGDKVCVECGKAADRICEMCGDRYCSVRWMGNPGCFERFHQKGKRADHVFAACEAPAMTREILELEERVKRKRKQDAEDAEAEAKKLAAAMLALAADAERTASRKPSRGKKAAKTKKRQSIQSSGSKRRVMTDVRDGTRRCSVETCAALALGDGIAFCAKHFTLQHALEVMQGNPLDAAKLLAQIEKAGGRLVPNTRTFLGSTLLGSLLHRVKGSEARRGEATARSGDRKANAKKAKQRRKTAASTDGDGSNQRVEE